jgi:hypothetical protein
MSPAGPELSPDSSRKTAIADASAAFLRAVSEYDPELARVIEAWPRLNAFERAGVLALVSPTPSQFPS